MIFKSLILKRDWQKLLNIVSIKWGNKFTSAHINLLYRSIKANLPIDHNFVCFTDNPSNIDAEIDVRPLWDDFSNIKGNYRKLKLYSKEILSNLDYNVIFLDIDTIVVNDLSNFANLNENALWKSPSIGGNSFVYNTSFVRIFGDEFCSIWDKFKKNPNQLIANANSEGWTGTDQAIVSHLYGGQTKTLSKRNGIISFRDDFVLQDKIELPRTAKIVSFYHNSKYGDMSDLDILERYPWVDTHWMSYANDLDNTILSKFRIKREYNGKKSNRKKHIEYIKKNKKLRNEMIRNAKRYLL